MTQKEQYDEELRKFRRKNNVIIAIVYLSLGSIMCYIMYKLTSYVLNN